MEGSYSSAVAVGTPLTAVKPPTCTHALVRLPPRSLDSVSMSVASECASSLPLTRSITHFCQLSDGKNCRVYQALSPHDSLRAPERGQLLPPRIQSCAPQTATAHELI